MITYLHSDYSLLRDRLVEEGYRMSHYSLDYSEWWVSPRGGELCVDLPETDPYESISVYFDYSVTTQELALLRFPL